MNAEKLHALCMSLQKEMNQINKIEVVKNTKTGFVIKNDKERIKAIKKIYSICQNNVPVTPKRGFHIFFKRTYHDQSASLA